MRGLQQPRLLQPPADRNAHQQGDSHLDQIKGDEGVHAGRQSRPQPHLGLDAVPGGAEGVQHGGAQHQSQNLDGQGGDPALAVLPGEAAEGPLDRRPRQQGHGQIAHQIAPRGTQQTGRAPHVVAEHRQARKAYQQVHQHAGRPLEAPQQAGGQVDGQGAPGEGDHPDGNGDGGDDADHRRHHPAQGELADIDPGCS